jgi:hypothetical protein
MRERGRGRGRGRRSSRHVRMGSENGDRERQKRTLLGPAESALSLAHLVAGAHEHLAKALLLPRRKHEDARQVVVIPAHLLLAEEADDLVCRRSGSGSGSGSVIRGISVRGISIRGGVAVEARVGDGGGRAVRDEQVVEEGRDVVEDGFGVEEELCEEAQVLGIQLVLFPVNLVQRVVVFGVDLDPRRRGAAQSTGALGRVD